MDKLTQRLYELSRGEYSFLKLASVSVSKNQKEVDIQYLYPEQYEQTVRNCSGDIEQLVARILATKLTIRLKLTKSCFFADTFGEELIAHLSSYPSIHTNTTVESIAILEAEDGSKIINIELPQSVYDYAIDAKIASKIKEHFCYKYHQSLNFGFVVSQKQDNTPRHIEKYAKKELFDIPVAEKGGGRYIAVSNREEFIGRVIDQSAMYISDAYVSERQVFCGRVEEFTELLRKPKENQPADKKFYRFKLRDFTGTIGCLYFPTQKTQSIITSLGEGKTIIVSGRVCEDNYNNESKLIVMVRDITYCTLPKQFSVNRLMRKVADEYMTVFPKPYVKPVQSSFFEVKEQIPSSLKGKRFCVFDLETTGLSPTQDDIIEIGAVIVDNGEITQAFTSFLAIDAPLPQKIIELTGITDKQLEGQPAAKDVLIDFFKFSYGMPLVGHNVSFDYGFINAHGEKYNIYFDNPRIDTMTLARRYLKNMRNFTLGAVAERLGIVNEDAHRALSDTLATAEAFIRLSRLEEKP